MQPGSRAGPHFGESGNLLLASASGYLPKVYLDSVCNVGAVIGS